MISVRILFLSLGLSVLCVACGPAILLGTALSNNGNDEKPEPIVQESRAEEEEVKKDKCSTKDDTSVGSDAVVQKDSVTLVRTSQIVKRLGCDGKPVNPKWRKNWEEVETPNRLYRLEAQTLKAGTKFYIGSPYNRSNCEYVNDGLKKTFSDFKQIGVDIGRIFQKAIRGELVQEPEVPHLEFTIDVANTTFHTRVLEGDNYIDYEFLEPCPKQDLDCEQSEQPVLEKGTLVLTMKQEVRRQDGVKVVDVCQPEEKDDESQN